MVETMLEREEKKGYRIERDGMGSSRKLGVGVDMQRGVGM